MHRKIECANIYAGPPGKGLSIGIAYVIHEHIFQAQKFYALNISDPQAVSDFMKNPTINLRMLLFGA